MGSIVRLHTVGTGIAQRIHLPTTTRCVAQARPPSTRVRAAPQVLAAIHGGTIDLHGRPVAKRWTKLAEGAPALANSTTLRLAESTLGWWKGGSTPTQVLITSTSFNWKQSEIRSVANISANGTVVTLAAPLEYTHTATIARYANAAPADMRAEVAFISSNVEVRLQCPRWAIAGWRVQKAAALMRVDGQPLQRPSKGRQL